MVWFIVGLPVILTLLCVILEVGNLYLARTELHDALEAAAQAAVKDWGDHGGGDTMHARLVGNNYAMANTINGVQVNLATIDPALNYDANEPCNQNACSNGVLVFGAIIADNPEFVFDCCATPGCGVGNVQFDATAQGSFSHANDWGISFQPTIFPIPDLRILRVIYRLPDQCEARVGAGMNFQTVMPRFNFDNSVPTVSTFITDDDTNVMLQDNCPGPKGGPSAQSDVYGIDRTLVTFLRNVDPGNPCSTGDPIAVGDPVSRSLAVVFPNDDNNDQARFNILDRIRFGAEVADTISNGQLDADAVGGCMTEITVCFSNGTTCTGHFVDTTDTSNQCLQCANVASPWGISVQPPPHSATNRGLIIHPTGIPDIPCPPGSSANNNGQALGSVSAGSCTGGGTGRPFAVRAEASYPVPSICCNLFGLPVGPFYVTAKADALYDCPTKRPRLYHLEDRNYSCNVNCP